MKTPQDKIKQIFRIIAKCYVILGNDDKKYRHETINSRAEVLEKAEAKMLNKAYIDSLPLKPGEGYAALKRAEDYLESHEIIERIASEQIKQTFLKKAKEYHKKARDAEHTKD